MKTSSYLLQTREYLGKVLCAYAGYKPTYTKWTTVRRLSPTTTGAREAEAWLLETPRGMEQRRLKLGRRVLTREQARATPAFTLV